MILDELNVDLLDKRITDVISKNIHYLHMPDTSNKPPVYIEYEIVQDFDSEFAGDEAWCDEATIQVDVFSNVAGLKTYFNLNKIIKTVLTEKDYGYLYGIELYEKETKLYHRGFRFNKKIFK